MSGYIQNFGNFNLPNPYINNESNLHNSSYTESDGSTDLSAEYILKPKHLNDQNSTSQLERDLNSNLNIINEYEKIYNQIQTLNSNQLNHSQKANINKNSVNTLIYNGLSTPYHEEKWAKDKTILNGDFLNEVDNISESNLDSFLHKLRYFLDHIEQCQVLTIFTLLNRNNNYISFWHALKKYNIHHPVQRILVNCVENKLDLFLMNSTKHGLYRHQKESYIHIPLFSPTIGKSYHQSLIKSFENFLVYELEEKNHTCSFPANNKVMPGHVFWKAILESTHLLCEKLQPFLFSQKEKLEKFVSLVKTPQQQEIFNTIYNRLKDFSLNDIAPPVTLSLPSSRHESNLPHFALTNPPFSPLATTSTLPITSLFHSVQTSQSISFSEKFINNFNTEKLNLSLSIKKYHIKFLKLINHVFFEEERLRFYNYLLKQRLHWSINLDDADLEPLILPVIESIINSTLCSNDKMLVLAAFIQYFNINIDNIFFQPIEIIDLKISKENLLPFFKAFTFAFRQSFPADDRKGTPTDDYAAEQACFTFMQIKQWEMKFLRLEDWLQNGKEILSKKVFLITQDSRSVKLLPYQAFFKGEQLIEMDIQHDNVFDYLSSYIQMPICQEIIFECTISLLQFSEFKKRITESYGHSPLIWPRKTTRWQEQEQDQPIAPPVASSSSDQSEKQASLPTAEKRKFTEIVDESPVILDDLKIKKGKYELSLEQVTSSSKQRKVGYYEKNKYKAISFTDSSIKERHASNKLEELIPAVLPSFASQENKLQAQNLSEFWNNLTAHTLIEIEQSVIQENLFFKILEEQKPIEYPLSYKLQLPSQDTIFPCCLPILKPYQKDVYHRFLTLEKKGLSPLISMEMGTGKSLVMMARILLEIAEGQKSKKIVFVPASIKENFFQESLRGLYEAKAAVFRRILDDKSQVHELIGKKLDKLLKEFTAGIDRCEFFPLMAHLRMYYQAIRDNNSYRRSELGQSIKNPFLYTKSLMNLCLPQLRFLRSTTQCSSAKYVKIHQQLEHLDHDLSSIYQTPIVQLKSYFIGKQELDIQTLLSTFIDHLQLQPEKFAIEPFLFFIGALLNLNLQDQQDKNVITIEMAQNILNFPFNKIIKANSKKDFVSKLQDLFFNLIIASHDSYQNEITTQLDSNDKNELPNDILDFSHLEKADVGLVLIDEGQNFHTPKTKSAEWAERLSDVLHTKGATLAIVTGTPFENNYVELLQLLHIANPNGFSKENLEVLKRLYNDAVYQLKESEMEKIQPYILSSFAHFSALRKIINELVLIKAKKSEDVIVDWDGLVPTENRIIYSVDLSLRHANTLEKIKKIEKENLTSFKIEKTVKKFLCCGKTSISSLSFKKNLDMLTDLRNNPEKLKKFIEYSPLFQTFFSNIELEQAMQTKKHILVIVENLLIGKIGSLACQDQFKIEEKNTQFFHGDLTEEERTQMIKWFKSPIEEQAKILFLSIKAGGVGLNLQEADYVFNLTLEYNPAAEEQAIARAVRVGNTGEKKIVNFFFEGIYLQHHQKAITSLKKQQMKFFFSHHDNFKAFFKTWGEILIEDNTKLKLNKCKNVNDTIIYKRSLEERFQKIFDSVSEQDLKQLVDHTTYFPPVVDLNVSSTSINEKTAIESTQDIEMQAETLFKIDDNNYHQSSFEIVKEGNHFNSKNLYQPNANVGLNNESTLLFSVDQFFQIPIGLNQVEAENFAAFTRSVFSTNKTMHKQSLDRIIQFFKEKSNLQAFYDHAFKGLDRQFSQLFLEIRKYAKQQAVFSRNPSYYQTLLFNKTKTHVKLIEINKNDKREKLRILKSDINGKIFYSVLLPK